MQPYQEASEEIRRQGEMPLQIVKNAGAIAGSAYLGGGAINKVLPFLSKYIPQDLAIKGLSKIDPRYGKFINKALQAGQSFDEVKEFIGSKIEEGSESKKPNDPFSFLSKYSPQLSENIKTHIQSGRSPKEAAALAYTTGKFNKEIQNIQKDTKENFEDYLERLFMNSKGSAQDAGIMQDQGQPQQGQPQQQQGGQGQQALMAILQKLQQARGQ